MKTYKETCAIFEQMVILEQLYEGGKPSKKPIREDSNRRIHVRKLKGGESTSPTNPKKVRARNCTTKNAGHTSDGPTGAKNTCLLHEPRNSSEEYKLIKIYSEKYSAQQPHKEKEACSGGKTKRGKSVNFDKDIQEINNMKSHDDPIPKKMKENELIEKCKSESAKSEPSEIGSTYGIDHLNLVESTHNLDNSSA